MERGDGALWTEPGVDGDLLFLPVAQAAVIRDADVLLQLRDLTEQMRWVKARPLRLSSLDVNQLLSRRPILSSCVI